MVFNATFNNIWAISWRSALLVDETVVPGENHRSVASHWQTLSHNVVSSTPRLSVITTTKAPELALVSYNCTLCVNMCITFLCLIKLCKLMYFCVFNDLLGMKRAGMIINSSYYHFISWISKFKNTLFMNVHSQNDRKLIIFSNCFFNLPTVKNLWMKYLKFWITH